MLLLMLLKIINLLVIISILGLVIKNIQAHRNIIMGLLGVALIISILSFIF